MADQNGGEGAQRLALWGDTHSIEAQTPAGPVEIVRRRTEVALSGGSLQPVTLEGIAPVAELEVLEALRRGDPLLVDMRAEEAWRQATIPGAVNLPFREIAQRLHELGCTGSAAAGWAFPDPRRIIAFCNGPACGQTPAGIRAMLREGYPADRILYYRGGLQDWVVLGLTTAEGR